jgi:hypothetical protein
MSWRHENIKLGLNTDLNVGYHHNLITNVMWCLGTCIYCTDKIGYLITYSVLITDVHLPACIFNTTSIE